jgi:hypothetical protein
VPDHDAATAAHENLDNLLAGLRLGAIPQILIAEGRSFPEILHASSQKTDLIFLGMAKPTEESFTTYYESLQARTIGLPTTLFVLAAPDFAFEEILTESTR